jgi:hypothetical protein
VLVGRATLTLRGMTDRAQAFREAFQKGEHDRAETQRIIQGTLAALKSDLERSGLGLTVESTDYDGLFVRSANLRSGWWAYLTANTDPDGIIFTVRAGFGQKNEIDSLRDTLPDVETRDVNQAMDFLASALERGLYYLGTLRR